MESRNKRNGTTRLKACADSKVGKPKSTRLKKPVGKNNLLGLNVELLEDTFQALSPQAPALVSHFYNQLFEQYPDIASLFANTSRKEQEKKLLLALNLVINNLRSPDNLVQVLSNLGKRHLEYGALPIHYTKVTRVLLQVMKEFAGDLWTRQAEQAWSRALSTVAATMISAYDDQEEVAMVANKKSMEKGVKLSAAAIREQMGKLQSIVDGAQSAIMTIDRNLVITYANEATVNLLKTHESALAEIYPGFSADTLIGKCIDDFHKNPAHQRRILDDPNNLPYDTDIDVGPLCFRLHVTAIYDLHGNYSGNTLEWSDITQLRQRDTDVMRLQSTVDNAMTAIMMIDRDLVITYVNQSTRDLLASHEETLRQVYPGFDSSKIIGTCIDSFHKNPAHQRKLLSNPNNLPYTTDIKVGPLTFNINVSAIMDAKGNYNGNSLEWSDVTEVRMKETEVARLQSAINGAQANLMLCDENLVITYANPAVIDMLSSRQAELREIWPSLDTNNIVGQCIDQFHKNPAHQRALLADKNRLPAKANINVGDLSFSVNATAILGPHGEYMGNMVEWLDITSQKDAERQIESLINKAVKGDLDERISTDQYEGFMKTIGDGINVLVDTVVKPIKDVTRVMKSLAEGDVTQSMEDEYSGEFAELRDAVNVTMKNLLNIVSQIRESSDSITSAAGEIAQGNQDLSQRTEEQAASLEQTAASMEQLTSTVKQNADNAKQADQLSVGAREQAEKGGEVVSEAIVAMSEINASSKKIADIIGVIDEIAFQTNLLALNAAVEAARAGEQGRGFAVVASEVRNLAQRSAGAAKEIKTLIKDSVEKVEEGSRLVDNSGATLDEIVNAVKKVGDIIAEIAAASQEQAAGIEEVNKAVTQMDETTQQNAALVEQAAAASESVNDQSNGLIEMLDFFEVGDKTEVRAPVTRTARREPVPTRSSASVASRSNKKAVNDNDGEWEDF